MSGLHSAPARNNSLKALYATESFYSWKQPHILKKFDSTGIPEQQELSAARVISW